MPRFFTFNKILWLSLFLTILSHAESAQNSPLEYSVQQHENLSEIAFKLYGSYGFYVKLAEWNNLSPPYRLKIGQKLALKEKPLLDPQTSGRDRAVYMWKRRFEIRAGEKNAEVETGTVAQTPNSAIASLPVSDFHGLPYSEAFSRAEIAFLDERYDKALEGFQHARSVDSSQLPAWFYEIRTLRLLKKDQDAELLSKQLIERRPELASLPMFRAK